MIMYFQTHLAVELLVRAECTYNADDVLDVKVLCYFQGHPLVDNSGA